MGDAVDLDEVVGALDRRQDRMRGPSVAPSIASGCAPGRATRSARPLASRRSATSKRDGPISRTVTRYGVVPWRNSISWPTSGVDAVGGRGWPRRGSGAAERVRSRPRVEGGRDEGDVGVPAGEVLVGSGQPVEPAGVDRLRRGPPDRSSRSSRNDLFVVPPRTMTTVWLSARCSRAERLVAVAAGGDDLGDHRVVLGRDHVAFGHARVDPDPGPGRQHQRLDRARRRSEAALRVLGVEPGLDRRSPSSRRCWARRPTAPRRSATMQSAA